MWWHWNQKEWRRTKGKWERLLTESTQPQPRCWKLQKGGADESNQGWTELTLLCCAAKQLKTALMLEPIQRLAAKL